MKIALFGKEIHEIKSEFLDAGLAIDEKEPDIVIAYGGDGTFLQSEARYPEIPKFLIKRSKTSKLSAPHSVLDAIEHLKEKKYSIKEVTKLKVTTGTHVWYALNEVVIHNQNPRHAVRLSLETPLQSFNEVIGDGVVVATVFGSTGYYRSITKESFTSGIGIAFNNSAQLLDSVIFSEDNFICTVRIVRGPAVVFVDNSADEVILNDGDVVIIEFSKKKAQVIVFG